MRTMLVALALTLASATALASPVMDDVRPPVASAQDHHSEVDWFQGQTAELQRRWVEQVGILPLPEREVADGGRARIDVRVNNRGDVSAHIGRSTGSQSLDAHLLEAMLDAPLAPPPASLPDEGGFVRFSVYFDIATRTEHTEDEPTDAA